MDRNTACKVTYRHRKRGGRREGYHGREVTKNPLGTSLGHYVPSDYLKNHHPRPYLSSGHVSSTTLGNECSNQLTMLTTPFQGDTVDPLPQDPTTL